MKQKQLILCSDEELTRAVKCLRVQRRRSYINAAVEKSLHEAMKKSLYYIV